MQCHRIVMLAEPLARHAELIFQHSLDPRRVQRTLRSFPFPIIASQKLKTPEAYHVRTHGARLSPIMSSSSSPTR